MLLYLHHSPFSAIIPFLVHTYIPIVGISYVMQNTIKPEMYAYLTENLVGLTNVL